MSFKIHMGVPEMEEKWNDLKKKFKEGSQSKDGADLYKKWGKALVKLAVDPFYPGLETHDIPPLYGFRR